ncbi:MAG TPA: type II toxin-antitoxin system death-on-curing family toxin [Prolixibacteraceae bacterium]
MVLFINIEQALSIHEKTVQVSGGGSLGTINTGTLESVLEHIQNDDYYPTFEEKLTHLVYAVNRNHSFSDGNKRLSISLGVQFLNLNGYLYCLRRFIPEMENISYHLAAGLIEKELLQRILHSMIENERDFDEELKLEIYTIINQDLTYKD